MICNNCNTGIFIDHNVGVAGFAYVRCPKCNEEHEFIIKKISRGEYQ